jgi:polysaccharide pyruvyl transferase WcaK-like protein
VRRAIETPVVLSAEERAFVRAARTAFEAARAAGARPERHVLVAGPGAGSIGDQAMLEAFVASVSAPVTLVARRSRDLAELPQALHSRVSTDFQPDLLYGLPHSARRAGTAFGRLLAGALSLSVVGADVMDGAYWESVSVRRFRIVRIAAELGVDARVLGFSWNAHPTAACRRAMVAASAVARLNARDPKSAERLLADGAVAVHTVADLAFLTQPAPVRDAALATWIEEQAARGRHIVIVNANVLLERTTHQVEAYVGALAGVDRESTAVLAVPHDMRGTPSDVDLAVEIAARLESVGVVAHAVRHELSPGEVMTIAGEARLTVSGRMHLTILSLAAGTPAVTIAYQGKVAGLYAAMGLDCWVEAGEGARAALATLVPESIAGAEALAAQVARGLPAQLERSRANLAGLLEPTAAG